MKLKTTLLTALLASSFFIGTTAQANPACELAWDNLRSAIAQYGGSNTKFGDMQIAEAQNQVAFACESSTIGWE
jgi:hypothetical protein